MSRPLCLLASGRFSLRLDADGGGGLRSIGSAGGLLACLVVFMPCPMSRCSVFSFHGLFDWLGSVAVP